MTNTKKPLKILQKKPRPSGWSTSDTDEIERRRLRGVNEAIQIEPETRDAGFFGCFRAGSGDGQRYHVEIRSLSEPINSCDCPDHRINGLGTCKHIEATLLRLQYRRKRAFHQATAAGSPFIEVFLDRRDHRVRIRWPLGKQRRSLARELLNPCFNEDGTLAGSPLDTLPALERSINTAPSHVRRRIRVSKELNPWLEILDRSAQQRRARQHFETEVASGKASLDLVRHPLFPYQREGDYGTSRSPSAPSWATRWDWARPSRPSPPASCCGARRGSGGCWWSLRPRSKPSGRSRSPSSPTCR